MSSDSLLKFDMQPFHSASEANAAGGYRADVAPPAKASDLAAVQQEVNTLKKVGFAILLLQGVLVVMLLVICIMAGNIQSNANALQDRVALKMPKVEGLIDSFSTVTKLFHSSVPDVAKRLLISDNQALAKAVSVAADKLYTAFNGNTASGLSGASSVAQIASLVRSVSVGLGQIQDVCPAAGGQLCMPPSTEPVDSDILSVPAYLASFLTNQTNVAEWRLAGAACSKLFDNMRAPNLAATYYWGPAGAQQNASWDFNSAKPTFLDIKNYCDVIAALP